MSYDPEKSGARDLPRERYIRVAYLLARKNFGPELLKVITQRGDAEWVRVAGGVYAANGFTLTNEELRTIFKHLEKKAAILDRQEKAREALIDSHRSDRVH